MATDLQNKVRMLKESELYIHFKMSALSNKVTNEELAKDILNNKIITRIEAKEILRLVNEPYMAKYDKKKWFGQLYANGIRAFDNADDKKITNWFDFILSSGTSTESKIDSLTDSRNPKNIKFASVGLITLILYLNDKSAHSVWFEGQHETLRTLFPAIARFNGAGSQYVEFNKTLENFAKNNDFSHTELDFVLSQIDKKTSASPNPVEYDQFQSKVILPSKLDFESAYRSLTCPGESISIDAVLDQLETNAKEKGLSLNSNWRIIMEKNIEIWAGNK